MPTCIHEKTKTVVRKFKNGSVHCVVQCQKCGDQVGGAKKWEAICESFDDWDQSICNAWKEECEADAERRKQDRDEWFSDYDEYLGSPQWKSLREKIMQRASGLCECCKNAPATSVHHLTYYRVGCEAEFDLIAVCHECHEALHVRHNINWGKK